MAVETSVILRAILYQLYNAKNLKAAINAVEAMSPPEDIALVKEQITKQEEEK